MNKTTLTAAVAALGIALYLALAGAGYRRAEGQRLAALEGRLVALEQARQKPADAAPPAAMSARLDRLRERVAQVEAGLQRQAVAAAEPAAATAPATAAAPAAASANERARFDQLLARVTAADFDWQEGGEALAEFCRLARSTSRLDDRIDELEHEVEAAPDDTGARMELAQSYVGKLLTVQGAEQGVWATRAEKQWLAVCRLDRDNWEASFRLGTNYAYYPDVVGKTDLAITYLQQARQTQESQLQGHGAVRPEYAQTYLALARLHQRKGESAQARAVLEAGVRLLPQDTGLREALENAR